MELQLTEWSQFEQFVVQLRADLEKHRSTLATWLARMSHEQVGKARKLLRGLVNADMVDRLAMVGKGQLEMNQVTLQISASTLKMLPESERRKLVPSVEVEVVGPRGVSIRKLGSLSGYELSQVIDSKRGILPAEAQVKRISGLVAKANALTEDLPEGGSVELRDGWIVLKDSAGVALCRVRPTVLRKFVR